ncbi:MAG: class II fructose-bisphosphate aldolase [Firmicutes bacterium]|nr:class II fructose-bisphosphate aldolase [Bacillota bacterium]
MLVSSYDILRDAKKRSFGYPAPDYFDYDSAKCFVETAEKLNKPLILSYAQVFDSFFPLEDAADIGLYLAKKAAVPVVLHLDHGTAEEYVEKAIDLGFTSVMLDASTDPFEENIRRTKEIVKKAHPLGICVEAEVGHVGSGSIAEDSGVYTEVEEAKRFTEETGVDSLAVSIGTAHGVYKNVKPVLNFQRLSELNEVLEIPLVLHGGSGTGDENISKCVKNGICKVNVYTEFLLAAAAALKEQEGDLHTMKAAAKAAVSEVLSHYYNICGE